MENTKLIIRLIDWHLQGCCLHNFSLFLSRQLISLLADISHGLRSNWFILVIKVFFIAKCKKAFQFCSFLMIYCTTGNGWLTIYHSHLNLIVRVFAINFIINRLTSVRFFCLQVQFGGGAAVDLPLYWQLLLFVPS